MTAVLGMLTLDELENHVSGDRIDTILVVFTDVYGRWMGKRYDASFFLDSAVDSGAHACDYLFTVDVEMEPVAGYRFASWERGYGDVHLLPDLATLRIASWLSKTAVCLCDVAARGGEEGEDGLLAIAPRSIVRAQIERARAMGFAALGASELEFYTFTDSYEEAARKGFAGLGPVSAYSEDYHILQTTREEQLIGAARRHLRDSGVPVENSKGEWGRGQHELNVRYTDVMGMADRHTVYKQCVKELAIEQGKSVTFMAKPDDAQAGSSCHLHLSLTRDGTNAFQGDGELGGVACSDAFRGFLAGWMARAPECMVLYAPNVNSYKRYRSGSWAPTRLAWSYDNRTAGFRVVGAGESLRIECRIPGADCNPYLAFAAALASGLDGIEQGLEPPPALEGDAYAAEELEHVPRSLALATDLFEQSEFARRVFGADVVEHYTRFFRVEQAAYDVAVTDWERRRYFEQI
jgi:glutamine synthetase